MKPTNLQTQNSVTRLDDRGRLSSSPRINFALRAGVILMVVGVMLSGLYWKSTASTKKNLAQPVLAGDTVKTSAPTTVPAAGITSLTSGYHFLLPQTPPPSPFAITTYASDCSTPKSVFNLQDTDTTVCAKVTGGALSSWRIIWSNARFTAVQDVPLGTGENSFTLTAASSLGDWRVIAFEPFGGSVYALTPFTVVDAANPSADLTISKSAVASPIAVGDQAIFGIQVTNLGPSDAATVQITDSIPANTTFASFAQLSGPAGFNCVVPTVGASTGETICTIPSLAKGETAIFVAAYDLIGGVQAGTAITNTSTVASTEVVEPPTPATPDPNLDNNSSTTQIEVTGAPTETCDLVCPANVVVTADTTSGGQPGAFVSFGAASGNGNCGAISNNPQSGSFFTVGTHSIISTAETGTTCGFTVTVLDSNPPTISCPPNITATAPTGATDYTLPDGPGTPTINASGGGTVTGVRSDNTPAQYDENGNVIVPAVVHALTDPYPIGTTGILWTVTDAGGRNASCTQTITILSAGDRDPVSITCPAPVSVTAPSGSCEATVSGATIGTPTTNPSDGDVDVTSHRSDGKPLSDPFPAGTTTITWTAHDDITNTSASCAQNVTVTVPDSGDTTPPTLVVPANVSTTTSTCTATLDDELGTAEASDTGACSGSVTITRTGVPTNFVFPTGTTTIIYTATDAAGNTSTGVQLVTVTESPAVPPTIAAPANVSVNTGAGATICGTVVSNAALGNASASDNCPGVTVVRTGVPAGNIFPVGNTTVTYTATDASGNTAFANQTVTVVDNTVPIVTPPAAVTLNTGAGATTCSVTVSNLDATLGTGSATDNCSGVAAVTRSGVPAGNAFPLGNTVVTYSATDAHGNIGSATQTVTVVDTTPPTITCAANIIADYDAAVNGAVVTYTTPVGTDNCSATTAQIAGLPSGSTFPTGTTTNTFRVTDGAGNTAECSFTVTVALTSLIGLDSVTMSGSGYADSYSSAGGYPATKGSLANILSNGTITMGGSAKVWGNVRSTRANVNMTGSSQVTGNATAGTTVTTSGSATVLGTRTNNALAPVMTLPAVGACAPFSSNSGISGTYSYNATTGNLTLSGVNIATLANGNYCFNNITLGNSAQLKVNGPVVIKMSGILNTSGATNLNNTTQIPSNLQILSSYSGSNGVVLGNSAKVYALIYAPNTGLNLSGSAPLFGTFAGKSLIIGNSGAIHYDTQLKTIWPAVWALLP